MDYMDHKEINDHFKQLNKDISELNKGIKQQQIHPKNPLIKLKFYGISVLKQ